MSIGKTKASLRVLVFSALFVAVSFGLSFGSESKDAEDSFLGLSMEDLLNIEVTSVSKRPQSLQDASAAIFVITGEDLHRLGVTSIPDALRLVPGLHVGRIDSNKWAVTSRGFNGRFSNKLLVLVDGRNVYTTVFSGVYWEIQDPMIADIERIEIIRGPGSTLWGANAVNGVINIITKHAADTQGGLAVIGAGDVEKGFAGLRWGTELADGTYAKVYGKAFSRGEFTLPDGQDAGDDWSMFRGGFQLNSQRTSSEALSFQGDIYNGLINQQTVLPSLAPPFTRLLDDDEAKVSGGHLLGRMVRTLSPNSEISFQVYFDRAVRKEALADQSTSQMDYDFQHQLTTSNHMFVWGLGYRFINDVVREHEAYIKTDGKKSFNLFSAFIQDEISLVDDHLAMTLGTKFEHNDFTGLEVQPSLRFIWRANNAHRVWAAVSRAVRTPMRAEDEFEVLAMVIPPNSPVNPAPLPVGVMIIGSEDFESEDLLSYELGYRFAHSSFSLDVTAFYNDYTSLQNNERGDPEVRYWEDPMFVAQPTIFNNDAASKVYGAELAVAWQSKSWLRWDLAYSYLTADDSSLEITELSSEKSPEHMLSLVFDLQPASALSLSAALRYVDECIARGVHSPEERTVPSYTSLDARIGWNFNADWELSLVGQNLLEESHLEYIAESFTLTTEVPRSFYVKLQWEF